MRPGLDAWEKLFAPYDEATYRVALSYVHADDVILDIGGGDSPYGCPGSARVCPGNAATLAGRRFAAAG